MDFENMMFIPALYQDIGSSYMMSPMMMPGMGTGMYPGMYPGMPQSYGISPMRPALSGDKFEKINEKEQETKHTIKKAALIAIGLTAAGAVAGRIFKVKNPAIFEKIGNCFKNGFQSAKGAVSTGIDKVKPGTDKIGSSVKNGYESAKNAVSNGFNKLKGLFKKNNP